MSDDNVTVFNPRVFEAAHVRLKTAPATLSDADLEQLAIFSPDLGLQAMEQREKALQPAPGPCRVTHLRRAWT
jgi:hypothetical protein